MTRTRSIRQILIGIVLLPLSVLPFLAYLTWTPEGRLVRDKALVAVNPPVLPKTSAADVAQGIVPAYEGAVMVLAYHGLGSASDAEGGFVVSPERFGAHLVALRDAGMTTVTAGQVADAFAGGTPLPPRSVMITFDDGRADAMMFADPLLEQAGMRATMFVITGAAEDPGLYYAGWDRLEKAARSGRWDLQSHTDNLHAEQRIGTRQLPLMTSLKRNESMRAYEARIDRDLTRADRALAKRSGAKPVALAYPFGAYGADRTNHRGIEAVLRRVVAKHQQLGFQQDDQKQMTLATPYDERTALRRLEVGDWTPAQLMRRIAGAAARTSDALAAREAQLRQQLDAGQPVPPGLVEIPAPTVAARAPRAARASTSRGDTQSFAYAPNGTASPSPAPAATSGSSPSAPSSPPTTRSSPPTTRSSPPTTSAPPTTRPPTTRPPTTQAPPPSTTPTSSPTSEPPRNSPGKSGDPHGNGKNKNND